MDENVLQSFRDLAKAMRTEPNDWQWIGPHMSQRMFGITEKRAKAYAARHGGTAMQMTQETRRAEATAKFHERAAAAYRSVGKDDRAASALRAARIAREGHLS